MSRAIFVVGATGKQGGATVKALLNHPSFAESKYNIFGMTRDPSSVSATRLEAISSAVHLVKGDLNDAAEAFRTLPVNPWGVFIVTNPQKKPKSEDEVGKSFVDEALKAGAKHIVFSSVERGSTNGGFNRTDVPHFMTKHDIEAHLMESTKSSDTTYTILRPVFFLDNLEWGFVGKVISTIWRDYVNRKLQVIDSVDIGKIAANAFMDPESPSYRDKAISLAGDDLTFEEANKIFKERVGSDIPVTYGIFAMLATWLSHDIGTMFKFFNDPGYDADIGYVNRLANVSNFGQWVDKSSFIKKKT